MIVENSHLFEKLTEIFVAEVTGYLRPVCK